jgi:molybdate/tungstate transport system substrate-binding protein
VSKTLKLSKGAGIKILGVMLIFGVILGGTAAYYGGYVPQQQQQQETFLGLLGLPTGGSVYVLSAGSLKSILNNASQQFEALHPGVHIYISYYGSVDCANRILQGTPCDLFFSADFYVIKNMLHQTPVPSFPILNYADWWVDFATNTVCIAYTTSGPNHLILSNTTWYQVLTSGQGIWARSDPDKDPCGYRTLITLNISDTYYPDHSSDYPGYPGNVLAYVLGNPPSIQIKDKSLTIDTLLQAGQIDAGFVYLSTAIQYGLNYITLPDNVSLGNQNYDAWYSQYSITTTQATYQGSWIKYGATIPNTASIFDKYWAVEFLKFVLSSDGQAMFTAGWQPTINPPVAEGVWSKVPSAIQSICVH